MIEKEEKKGSKFLEGKPITSEELQQLRETLPKNKRLVEISPQHYKVLEVFRE